MNQKMRNLDNRRFARVITASKSGNLHSIESLTLTWETGEKLKVFDISYGGIACQIPLKQIVKSGDLKTIQIHFSKQQDVIFPVEVVWVSEEFVGLNFEPLSVQARSALNDFLDSKLLGVGLRLIDKKYYSEGLSCQRWFQGVHGVNVYLWENDERVETCEVEVEDYTVKFGRGKAVVTQNDLGLNSKGVTQVVAQIIETREAVAKQILEQLATQDKEVKQFLDRLNEET